MILFEVTDGTDAGFVIALEDEAKVEHARRILRGEECAKVHIQGTIVKSPADYNSKWSFHLEPESIDFFEFAIEVCDAAIGYVEDNLNDVDGATLPGLHWCPWSSRVVREIV